jgi:hypothetical protein
VKEREREGDVKNGRISMCGKTKAIHMRKHTEAYTAANMRRKPTQ